MKAHPVRSNQQKEKAMNYKPTELKVEADVEYDWPFDPTTKVRFNSAGTVYLCTCGQSKKAPFCDGTHVEYNANLARGGEQSIPSEGNFENGSR
jgi:CDGSH-type Zn-finger protein